MAKIYLEGFTERLWKEGKKEGKEKRREGGEEDKWKLERRRKKRR